MSANKQIRRPLSPLERRLKGALRGIGIKDSRPGGKSEAVLLFFTGYRNHFDDPSYMPLFAKLRALGVWVRVIELPNHDPSGHEDHGVIEDFDEAVRVVPNAMSELQHDKYYEGQPIFLAAHSMGAHAVILALARYKRLRKRIRGVHLTAIPFHLEKHASKLVQKHYTLLERAYPFFKRFKAFRYLQADSEDLAPGKREFLEGGVFDELSYTGELHAVTAVEFHLAANESAEHFREALCDIYTVRVVQGLKDDTALPEYSREVYRTLSHPMGKWRNYVTYNGEGHSFSPTLALDVVKWISYNCRLGKNENKYEGLERRGDGKAMKYVAPVAKTRNARAFFKHTLRRWRGR